MTKHLFALALAAAMASGAVKSAPSSLLFEDTFALYALDAQAHQKYPLASQFFEELYKQSGKKEYLYQSLRMLEYANDTASLSKKTAAALAKSPEDDTLKRFEIVALLKKGRFGEASQKAQSLAERSRKSPDYLLYAEARLKLADYQGALEALKNAYNLTYDENTAERISLLLYTHLEDKKEAIAFLKKHIGEHGNSIVIGKRLASLYADQHEFDDAAAMYEQTFEAFSDPSSAEEAAKVYLYQENFPKLTLLLEKSHINDPMLVDLYVKAKQFDKASTLAHTLYEREDNPLYLAQSAVFSYEGANNKNDPVLLSSVIDGLKKASEDLEEPLYLNYLGYLMIDHDINVSEGMRYVKRALDKQPDSPFYIDSLAWGKYKLGECDEAKTLIEKVKSMIGTDEPEVKEHLDAIKTCKSKEKN